jgi:hypothetical protein
MEGRVLAEVKLKLVKLTVIVTGRMITIVKPNTVMDLLLRRFWGMSIDMTALTK